MRPVNEIQQNVSAHTPETGLSFHAQWLPAEWGGALLLGLVIVFPSLTGAAPYRVFGPELFQTEPRLPPGQYALYAFRDMHSG